MLSYYILCYELYKSHQEVTDCKNKEKVKIGVNTTTCFYYTYVTEFHTNLCMSFSFIFQ